MTSLQTDALYVEVFWGGGCILSRVVTPGERFRAGTSSDCDLALAHVPFGGLDVVTHEASGAWIRFQPFWSPQQWTGENWESLAEANQGFEVRSHPVGAAPLRLQIGDATVVVVRQPRQLIARPPSRFPYVTFACVALALVLLGWWFGEPLPPSMPRLHAAEAIVFSTPKNAYDSVAPTMVHAEQTARVRRVKEWARDTREELRASMRSWSGAPNPVRAAQAHGREAVVVAVRGMFVVGGTMREIIERSGIRFDASKEAPDLGSLLPSQVTELAGGWGYGIRKIGPGSGDGKDWGTVASGNYQAGDWDQGAMQAYLQNALTRPPKLKPPKKRNVIPERIDYDELRGRLGMMRGRLRRCFEGGTPDSLTLSLDVDSDGQVVSGRARAISQEAQTCLQEALSDLRLRRAKPGPLVSVAAFQLAL